MPVQLTWLPWFTSEKHSFHNATYIDYLVFSFQFKSVIIIKFEHTICFMKSFFQFILIIRLFITFFSSAKKMNKNNINYNHWYWYIFTFVFRCSLHFVKRLISFQCLSVIYGTFTQWIIFLNTMINIWWYSIDITVTSFCCFCCQCNQQYKILSFTL